MRCRRARGTWPAPVCGVGRGLGAQAGIVPGDPPTAAPRQMRWNVVNGKGLSTLEPLEAL